MDSIANRLTRLADHDPRSDGELLRRYRQDGDHGAFAELLRRLGPVVLAVCRRALADRHAAEDAFQAVFVALARSTARPPPENLAGWLHAVSVRTAHKVRRSAARRLTREERAAEPSLAPDPAVVAEQREVGAILDQEIANLPDGYRTVLVACELAGRTRTQVAAEFGWPTGTVATRLAKARELLAARLRRRGVTLGVAAVAGAVASAGLQAATLAVIQTLSTDPHHPAVALADEVLRSMTPFRPHRWLAAALLLAAAGPVLMLAPAGDPPPAREPVAAKAPVPKREPKGWAEGEVLKVEGERIARMAFSPDGKTIALGRCAEVRKEIPDKECLLPDGPGEVALFDVKGRKVVQTFPVKEPAFNTDVAFNAGGTRLAFTHRHGVTVLDAATFTELAKESWQVKEFAPVRVVWVPTADEKEVLAMSNGAEHRVRTADELKGENLPDYRHRLTLLAADPVGRRVVFATNPTDRKAGDDPFHFRLTPTADPTNALLYGGHTARPTHALVTPDGQRLVSADDKGEVIVWQTDKPELLRRVKFTGRIGNNGRHGHGYIRGMAMPATGGVVAVVNQMDSWRSMQEVAVLDATSGRLIAHFVSHDASSQRGAYSGVELATAFFSEVNCLAFSPDGNTLVAAEAGLGHLGREGGPGPTGYDPKWADPRLHFFELKPLKKGE